MNAEQVKTLKELVNLIQPEASPKVTRKLERFPSPTGGN